MPLRRFALAAVLLLGAVVAAAVVASGGRASKPLASSPSAESWRGLVGGKRFPVALGQRMIVVMRAPSLAQRVQQAGGVASDDQERRWTSQALSAQQDVLLELDTKGIFIKPELRFTRVLNGFSAALDPSAVQMLERLPQVVGVYRVRAAYPASVTTTPLVAAARAASLAPIRSSVVGLDGNGVLVALLDTGVDRLAPYLHAHALTGLDVAGQAIDGRPHAAADGALERHGTEMAGIVVGSGRGGISGVAPGATVLPIRVGGWQRDDSGRFALYARTDQILAGLDRAVDPDGNGDAHDAARIALVPLAEPFGAFEDGPLARAAAGAAALDTLVITPAGNDGPAGPAFGSLSGPGGAPAALTVAAADLRARELQVRLVVRDGLHVLLNGDVPVLGATGPAAPASVRLVAPGPLFDRRGMSRVAGQAVLLPVGADPNDSAAGAARAGAAIVLLSGDAPPAGALGRGQALGVPVLGVPSSLLDRARDAGAGLELSVGAARRAVVAADRPGIPRFSSWGLGDGGHPKPEVAGPGVGIVTVDPGASSAGSSNFVLVDGTSAAAAAVAGEAAIVVQARPGLTASELKSALVGTARSLPDEPSAAQGNGLVDIGSGASVEVVSQPATLAFGRASGQGWASTRALQLRNVSTRRLRVYVSAPSHDPALALYVEPRQLTLAPGQTSEIQVAARLDRATGKSGLTGTVTVAPLAGTRLRIPWAVVTRPVSPRLIGTVQLSSPAFKPSDLSPAILFVQLGQVDEGAAGVSLEPVLRLDIRLRDQRGKDLGLLSRLRDVLPGRYAFGLTGRGPDSNVLPAGRYSLGLLAFPAAGGRAVMRSVAFTVK
jgi:subtilisin family serine protease